MTLSARALGHTVPTQGGPRVLFHDLDLSLQPGVVTAVVGRNGAGKTTLLKILAGLLTPTQGTVQLDGQALSAHADGVRAKRIAYLPQTTPLVHDLEVRELVMLGRAPHISRVRGPTSQDAEAVAQALARTKAQGLSGRRVFSLSGGEYQRVMVARMLATQAEILLLDEPTTALDIGHALSLMELLRDLAAEGKTVLASIHDLNLARGYADEAVCLRGDPEGSVRVGDAKDVVGPDEVARAFGVEAKLLGETLVVGPRDGG